MKGSNNLYNWRERFEYTQTNYKSKSTKPNVLLDELKDYVKKEFNNCTEVSDARKN